MIRGFTAVTIASVFAVTGITSCGARTTTEDEFGLGGTGGASAGVGGKAVSTGGKATGVGGVPNKSSGGYPSYGGVVGYGARPGYGGVTAGGAPSYGGYPTTGGVPGYGGKATGGTAAGAASSTLHASNFDQYCGYDSDCFAVVDGDQCSCRQCPNAAINLSANSSWFDYLARIQQTCPPVACEAIPCAPVVPVCHRSTGMCDVRTVVNYDASQFDRSCKSDNECALIYVGDPCSSCRCATGAVNTQGAEAWKQKVASFDCSPPPSACDCAPSPSVFCLKPAGAAIGTCSLGPAGPMPTF